MESENFKSSEEKFIDRVALKHTTILLETKTAKDASYGIKFLELLLHYEKYDAALKFLAKCVDMIDWDGQLILRQDNIAIQILSGFVSICLKQSFAKHYTGTNLLGECFLICSDAPQILRCVCHLIFKICGIKNPSDSKNLIGYRAISSLIIFRYCLGEIVNRNLHDETVMMECKKIKDISSFGENCNPMIISLIKMLISCDIDCELDFRLCEPHIHRNFGYIIRLLESVLDKSNEIIILSKSSPYGIRRMRRQNVFNRISSLKTIQNNTQQELIKRILSDYGLDMYSTKFNENNITFDSFLQLDAETIGTLGIENTDHKKKILKLVQKYNQVDKNKIEEEFNTKNSKASQL